MHTQKQIHKHRVQMGSPLKLGCNHWWLLHNWTDGNKPYWRGEYLSIIHCTRKHFAEYYSIALLATDFICQLYLCTLMQRTPHSHTYLSPVGVQRSVPRCALNGCSVLCQCNVILTTSEGSISCSLQFSAFLFPLNSSLCPLFCILLHWLTECSYTQ